MMNFFNNETKPNDSGTNGVQILNTSVDIITYQSEIYFRTITNNEVHFTKTSNSICPTTDLDGFV